MLRVTYYALAPLTVGDSVRQPGELVPEAMDWPYLPGYVSDGKIAPVLVATLPEDVQKTLLAWEEAKNGVAPQTVAEAKKADEAETTSKKTPQKQEK